MACARNDKLFSDGSDLAQLAKEVRYVIGGTEEVAKTFRVIALPKSWLMDPWTSLDESEQPANAGTIACRFWCCRKSRTVSISVLAVGSRITQKRRNTIRFLLPRPVRRTPSKTATCWFWPAPR